MAPPSGQPLAWALKSLLINCLFSWNNRVFSGPQANTRFRCACSEHTFLLSSPWITLNTANLLRLPLLTLSRCVWPLHVALLENKKSLLSCSNDGLHLWLWEWASTYFLDLESYLRVTLFCTFSIRFIWSLILAISYHQVTTKTHPSCWLHLSGGLGSSRPREPTLVSCVSCIGRLILYHCSPGKPSWPLSFSFPALVINLRHIFN